MPNPIKSESASPAMGRDMTVGSIPRHLLSIAIPMLIGNFLNTGYGIVNTIWVGQFLGKDAVAATAISFPVLFILIGLAAGATMATTILVSQFYGAKNFPMVEKVVQTSFAVSLMLGVCLSLVGIFVSDHILHMMNTPEAIFPMASSYLKLMFVGFIFMFFSFLVSSILRGIGDTKTPLAFMAIGVALNAILDPLLILGVGPFPRLGLNGAAIASVISSAIALVVGIVYLNKKSSVVAFHPGKLLLDKEVIGLILKIGFPSMIQQTLVSLGGVFITTFVNGFGAVSIAAFGAGGRIESLAFMPAMTMSMAVSALAGQNLGAGKPERVYGIMKWGILMILIMNITIMAVVFIAPHMLIALFVKDPSVIAAGVVYLRITAISYIFFGVMFVSNGVIMGAGHTMVTMVFTLVSLWGIRVPLASYLSHTTLGINGIWISIVTSFFVIMCASLGYFFSGKWKKVVVRKGLPTSLVADNILAKAEP